MVCQRSVARFEYGVDIVDRCLHDFENGATPSCAWPSDRPSNSAAATIVPTGDVQLFTIVLHFSAVGELGAQRLAITPTALPEASRLADVACDPEIASWSNSSHAARMALVWHAPDEDLL
jgi:hypothetical protein